MDRHLEQKEINIFTFITNRIIALLEEVLFNNVLIIPNQVAKTKSIQQNHNNNPLRIHSCYFLSLPRTHHERYKIVKE